MIDIRRRIRGTEDPFQDLMKRIGYLPVRMPRAGLEPLEMIACRGNQLNLLGQMEEALEEGAAGKPPAVNDIQTAATVQQTHTAQMERGAGLSILGNILGAITGNRCDISTGFEQAATMSMEFAGVTIDRVEIVKLDRYLSRAAIHPDSRAIRERLMRGECGVITAVMRCARYVVSAHRAGGARLSLDVPLLARLAGGAARVSAVTGDASKVAYEGPVPLVFGVQAVRLFYDRQGRFTAFDPMTAGVVRGLAGGVRVPRLFPVEGDFVEWAAA